MYATLNYKDGVPTTPILGSPLTPHFADETYVLDSGLDMELCASLAQQAIDSGEMEIVAYEMAMPLANLMAKANSSRWGIAVTGMYQPPTLITYRPGQPVHSNGWHTDYAYDDRSKIGVSVLLQNADEGGDFIVRYDSLKTHLEVGQALVIPGYVPHRIGDVARGTRVSLVGWLGGPEWI